MKGQVYKVSSLANGSVSLVFHVNPGHAETALGYLRLRGRTVELTLTVS